MIHIISITGTESTGKTELAGKLAAHYETIFVPDVSRLYIEKLNRTYNENDVLEIARKIIEEENKFLQRANKILFSDNCLINAKIWLQYYDWRVPDFLQEEILQRKNNLYLLCNLDIEWTADEQRKNQHDREKLFARFEQELNSIEANFKVVSGKWDVRFQKAVQVVNEHLLNSL